MVSRFDLEELSTISPPACSESSVCPLKTSKNCHVRAAWKTRSAKCAPVARVPFEPRNRQKVKRPEEVAKHLATASRHVGFDHRVTLVPCGLQLEAAEPILRAARKKRCRNYRKS